MALRVKPEIAAEIDSQIWDIYRNRLGGSELRQLAKLFKRTGLLTRLENILSSTLRTPTPHCREDLEIRLAWIDKRPLAKLETNPRRVELGDAAIFFFDVLQNAKTKWYPQSRAVILQAKADAMRARRTTGSGNSRISISAIAMKGALIYSFGHDARP
jgi:hypothetical protein